MANPRKWSNVAVAIGPISGSAIAITGITKAATGVVSTAGAVPTNGSWVWLEVQGMTQVNEALFRVTGAGAGVFSLEDVDGTALDTTAYDAFVSGSFRPVTFTTSVTTATTISPSGGEFDQIDTTTIHGSQRSSIPGLPSAMSYQMDHMWDVQDPGLQALNAAYKASQKQAILYTFGVGGPKMAFGGYVGATLLPGGQSQGLVTTNTVFSMNGFPTYYAS